MTAKGLWPEQPGPFSVPWQRQGVRIHTDYRHDVIGWARDVLEIPERTMRWALCPGYDSHQWDGTEEPLETAFKAIQDWQHVGIESATGTGKSFATGVLVLWFLACWEDARVFTMAPKEEQLRLFSWMEIGRMWPRFQRYFPDAVLTDLRIRMRGGIDDSWGAVGVSVGLVAGEEISSKAQGMHAKDMLLVYEEMPGIPLPIITAGRNTCTAPHNLIFGVGNPNHRQDTLHQHCKSAGTKHVVMSALDHPNVVTGDADVVPGAVSIRSIENRRIDYGEDSPVYQSRVRGISPAQAADALIRLEWLEQAALRYETRKAAGNLPYWVTGKGVDVANSISGDRACIVDFADDVMVRCDAFPCPDSNALGARVVDEAKAYQLDAWRIGIDSIGVGAGTVNEARRLEYYVQSLNASAAPVANTAKAPDGSTYDWAVDANLFRNLRSQMYWQLREDLRLGRIDIPKIPDLWEELTMPTFVDEPVTTVEQKKDIKKRLGRSPDKADAVVYANWVRKRVVKPYIPADNIKHKTPDRSLGVNWKEGKPNTAPVDEQLWAAIERPIKPSSPLFGRYSKH